MKHSELRHQPRHVNPRIQVAMIIPAIRFIPKHRREEPAGRMVEVRTMSIERFGLMESAVK